MLVYLDVLNDIIRDLFNSRSEETGAMILVYISICVCISFVRSWFDYQIKKCEWSSLFSVNMFTIWLTEVIIVTCRFLYKGQYRMHSCTFDTAFVFLNIFIVLYILGEMTEYMLGGKKK